MVKENLNGLPYSKRWCLFKEERIKHPSNRNRSSWDLYSSYDQLMAWSWTSDARMHGCIPGRENKATAESRVTTCGQQWINLQPSYHWNRCWSLMHDHLNYLSTGLPDVTLTEQDRTRLLATIRMTASGVKLFLYGCGWSDIPTEIKLQDLSTHRIDLRL